MIGLVGTLALVSRDEQEAHARADRQQKAVAAAARVGYLEEALDHSTRLQRRRQSNVYSFDEWRYCTLGMRFGER